MGENSVPHPGGHRNAAHSSETVDVPGGKLEFLLIILDNFYIALFSDLQ